MKKSLFLSVYGEGRRDKAKRLATAGTVIGRKKIGIKITWGVRNMKSRLGNKIIIADCSCEIEAVSTNHNVIKP